MGIVRDALNDSLELMGEARLASMAFKDDTVCANCKHVMKATDSRKKECIACSLTGNVVYFSNTCSRYQKPFLGQSSDKRKDLILRDLLYRKYHQ